MKMIHNKININHPFITMENNNNISFISNHNNGSIIIINNKPINILNNVFNIITFI